MTLFKDEELVILRELGFKTELKSDVSALYIVARPVFLIKNCSYLKRERCMLALISLCDDATDTTPDSIGDSIRGAITRVASGLDTCSGYTSHTVKTLRTMLKKYYPKNIYVLSYAIASNYNSKYKIAIQCALESEPNDDELHHGLKDVYKRYIENTFAYDMIIESF